MAKILIAEDDEFLGDILLECLTEHGYEVRLVPNGKVAKDVALTGNFDLILSDVQMPFLNGVELLQWLRLQSTIPFILMTGFTNLLETTKAAEFGAQGFLTKPFSNKDLISLIKNLLSPSPKLSESEAVKIDSDYCKVAIDEFVARPKIDFDIYVRLNEARYLKIAHQGETLDVERLRTYKSKGITHLHIRKEDFDKLVNFNMQVCNVLKTSGQVSEEKRVRFVRYTAEVILERCFVADMNKEAFGMAEQFVQKSLSVMTSSRETLDLVSLLNEHSDYLYAHSLGVSIYSVMIAQQLKYNSAQTIFKLAISGMLHDIGKKEIEREILFKQRALMTVVERKVIESHVARGREILESIPGIPSDVIQIVYEHHEDEIEQGYPRGTPKAKLHPLSRIVHVADLFANLALKGPNNSGMSAEAAISVIEKFNLERINKTIFASLKSLVEVKKAA